MKKMIIGTMVAMSLIVGFTMVHFWDNPSTVMVPNSTFDKSYQPEINPNTFKLAVGADQGDSIFSFPSIITLCLVIIGIVAFRQNSYI